MHRALGLGKYYSNAARRHLLSKETVNCHDDGAFEDAVLSEMHASVYLTSRVASAVVNAAAVAVFTRISSQELYGQYLIGFAICFVIFSFGVQWATHAHFGRYNRREADRLAGALLVICATSSVLCLAAIGVFAYFRVLPTDIAIASGILLLCFTVFFTATEIGRTHLMVGAVTVATLTRSFGSLALGAAALTIFQTPAALLVGVGLGYAAGAAPVLVQLMRTIWSSGFVWPEKRDLAALLIYGWPLIFAFGASAAAMNIERILLERMADATVVAPYGAVLDFMKQTFLVVAEAISVGYVSYAKTLQTDGDADGATGLLKRAFVTQIYLIVFGTVFFTLFGGPLFSVLLPASYLPTALQVFPILLVANSLLVLRAYHFGQVIYLGASSKLEFTASAVMLLVTTGTSFLFIPVHGTVGAAIAFTLGQAAALLVYVVATPRQMRLPIEWGSAGVLTLTGMALIVVGFVVNAEVTPIVAVSLNLALLTLASAYFLVAWNLFEAKVVMRRFHAQVTRRFSEL